VSTFETSNTIFTMIHLVHKYIPTVFGLVILRSLFIVHCSIILNITVNNVHIFIPGKKSLKIPKG